MPALYDITVGSRVILRDRPCDPSMLVTDAKPSAKGHGLYVTARDDGGVEISMHSDGLVAVPAEFQDAPAWTISQVQQVELMYDSAIPTGQIEAAEDRDARLDAMASRVYAAKSYVRWVQTYLYPLNNAMFEPYLLQSRADYRMAADAYTRAEDNLS